jgi:membrane peptidoglycan carboxypeptidase
MLLMRALRTLILGIVVGGVAIGACLAAIVPGGAEIVSAHHYTVKTVTKLRDLSQKSTVYWSDGVTKMDELGIQDRQNVTFNEIPVRVTNAVIATEDQTFWTNDGIDLGAVFRAFVTNVTSGGIEQGGSTITQQLVKNRILSPARDVNRKVKEIEDALRLNERFSKKKILEEYLNTVYFGQNSYGIKSAASRFFITTDPGSPFPRGKHLDELTIGEAALLAGVIANPEGTNPFTYPSRAAKRRADVLQAEVGQGYITQAEAYAAENEPMPTWLPQDELRPRSLLVSEVQDRLLADPRLGKTPKERRNALLKGGLSITTTFDKNLQTLADDAVRTSLPASPSGPDWVSSLVSIDPTTGAVKAMAQTADFADSQYNIGTHPVGRQPGSTWKVITLAAALANGYSPNDTVQGQDPCSVPKFFGNATTINSGDGEGGFNDLWHQTSGSVNCAFVRLSTSIGQDKVMDMAHKMGIVQQRLFPHLTLSIGDIEATPLEMATVMSTIANDGVHQSPYFVQRVTAPNNTVPVIDESNRAALGDRVLDADVAECEQLVLRGVITGGTGTKAALQGHEPFGKTGTTDHKSDGWFIGATPQLATAVWFGNRTTNQLSAGFGGDVAAPIWRVYMQSALEGQPDLPLPDRGGNAVCNRPGKQINEDGGHGGAAPIVSPQTDSDAQGQRNTPAPTPTVITTPPPTTPPATTVPTTPPPAAPAAPAAATP